MSAKCADRIVVESDKVFRPTPRAGAGLGPGILATTLVAILALLSACGNPASPSPGSPGSTPSVAPGEPVVVTLGIYSGLADPTWTLTVAEAAVLDAALAALPDSTGTPPVGGLGYHGFTITRPGNSVVAYRGAIAPPGDGRRAMKSDPSLSIERYLLETSRSHVTPGEYAIAELGIPSP